MNRSESVQTTAHLRTARIFSTVWEIFGDLLSFSWCEILAHIIILIFFAYRSNFLEVKISQNCVIEPSRNIKCKINFPVESVNFFFNFFIFFLSTFTSWCFIQFFNFFLFIQVNYRIIFSLNIEFITLDTSIKFNITQKLSSPWYDIKRHIMVRLGNEEYPFINITLRSTLTRSGSAYYGPIYKSNRIVQYFTTDYY